LSDKSSPSAPPAKPILLIVCGAVPVRLGVGETFAEMFIRSGGLRPEQALVVDAIRKVPPASLEDFGAVIVTGSLSMVTDRTRWSLRLGRRLAQAMELGLPILGVCFGHQLLAQTLGGQVDYRPQGPEIGSHVVTLTPAGRRAPLLQDLPPSFPAQLYHSQSVTRPPSQAVVLASSAHDPHQILGYGPNTLTCQFHPEFSLQAMTIFVDDRLRSRRPDEPEQMALPLVDAPESASLVPRFLAQARSAQGLRPDGQASGPPETLPSKAGPRRPLRPTTGSSRAVLA
jgi:GMP synthase (glutamine-hydrolysing)